MERLQKFLARAGVASRRACEELIRAGRVQVNGKTVTKLGTRIDPQRDRVDVDGRKVEPPASLVTIMLNKPAGYVTTCSDEHGRPTVLDLVPENLGPLHPVGRLDMDTEGLLLLTNDGELTYRLTHPKFKVEKEYVAEVEGVPSESALRRLREGVEIDGDRTAPAQVKLEKVSRRAAVLRLRIHEGRKRQVKRMLSAVGHPVRRLRRVQIGPIKLGALPLGDTRPLSREEVDSLRRCAESED